MDSIITYFENNTNYVDAATICRLTGSPRSSTYLKLSALEQTKEFTTVQFGYRKLYHVSILKAFGITMSSQSDATSKTKEGDTE